MLVYLEEMNDDGPRIVGTLRLVNGTVIAEGDY